MIRFGKPSASYLNYIRYYFDPAENEAAARSGEAARLLYMSLPERQICKVCRLPLSGHEFKARTIPYIECSQCGHINGKFEESEAFSRSLYQGSGSDQLVNYYASASREAFDRRVAALYRPKVDFLFDVLRKDGQDPGKLSYADIGAGTGYFPAALLDAGAKSVKGYEVSARQIATGNDIFGREILFYSDPEALPDLLLSLDTDVVTMIFTLEHVRQHHDALLALRNNPRIRYALIAVPAFSLANFLEAAFADMFGRHSDGHTHFYTPASIDWMCRHYNLPIIGEWWFGADMIDILRTVSVALQNRNENKLAEMWEKFMEGAIDPMQEIMDRRKTASEVHLVVRCY